MDINLEDSVLIEKYIKEMKGVDVKVNPPSTPIQLYLFVKAVQVAKLYFENNKQS